MSNAPRLKVKYAEEIAAQLKDELGLDNPMQVPSLEKIVLNMGLGEAVSDKKAGDPARPQVDRQLQAARGDADRCLCHSARREHVGVLRQAAVDRHTQGP